MLKTFSEWWKELLETAAREFAFSPAFAFTWAPQDWMPFFDLGLPPRHTLRVAMLINQKKALQE